MLNALKSNHFFFISLVFTLRIFCIHLSFQLKFIMYNLKIIKKKKVQCVKENNCLLLAEEAHTIHCTTLYCSVLGVNLCLLK